MNFNNTNLIYFLLFIGIFYIIYILFFNKVRENLTSFSECRAKGYSKEFCLQTPTLYWGPQSCVCEDGTIGVIHPGLRGQCLCSRYY